MSATEEILMMSDIAVPMNWQTRQKRKKKHFTLFNKANIHQSTIGFFPRS